MLSTQPYKGARDFYPDEKRRQKWMFTKLRSTCERFGYLEYDAPILESTELYLAKGNEEIIHEQTYTFQDRGDRSVTIRTEMTPTVSRMVAAKRNELNYPLRWYSIPNLWRYERPQRGRLREFWQLNVDLFGIEGICADFEIISVANAALQAFGANSSMYTIQINDRRLSDYILNDILKLDQETAAAVRRAIDRKSKLTEDKFIALLSEIVHSDHIVSRLVQLLAIRSLEDLPSELADNEVVSSLKELFALLHLSGIENAVFDITLMRGFDYYTGVVFEIVDTDPQNNRAMFGGGRYDGLIANFGVQPVPTVGFGMGDVTLMNFLESHDLIDQVPSEVDLAILLVGDIFQEALPTINKIRALGINTSVDFTSRKIDKKIKSAVKDNIKAALILGTQELETGVYKLKYLNEAREVTVVLDDLQNAVLGS